MYRCTKCGYEMEAKGSAKGYRVVELVDKEERVVTTSRVSEPPKRKLRTKEEQEQELEEYYEVALELLQEEFEGGEG